MKLAPFIKLVWEKRSYKLPCLYSAHTRLGCPQQWQRKEKVTTKLRQLEEQKVFIKYNHKECITYRLYPETSFQVTTERQMVFHTWSKSILIHHDQKSVFRLEQRRTTPRYYEKTLSILQNRIPGKWLNQSVWKQFCLKKVSNVSAKQIIHKRHLFSGFLKSLLS